MDIIELENELLTFDELEALVIIAESKVERYVAESEAEVAEVAVAEPVAEPVAEEAKAEVEAVAEVAEPVVYPENLSFCDSLSSDDECQFTVPPPSPHEETKGRPIRPSEDAVWFESLDSDGEGYWQLPPPPPVRIPAPSPSPKQKKEYKPIPRVVIHPIKKPDPVDANGNPIFLFP